MKSLYLSLALASALSISACSQPAEVPLDGDWQLDSASSRLIFTTVKAGQVTEAHSFTTLAGSVSADGAAQLVVDLASVATNVDIRDERMRDVLFDIANFPEAKVSAQVDPAAFADLAVGASLVQEVPLTLEVHGTTSEIAANLAVTRIAADKVLVETAKPLILSAASLGLDAGVEQLRQLANLDSITGQVPVSVSLTFARDAGE